MNKTENMNKKYSLEELKRAKLQFEVYLFKHP